MIDRNVEFPNRFRMTKVEGTDDIYDLIPAPGEVIAPGDTFSKANMLPDSIPAALGLKMGNPQVKDALNVLANIGNVHVWSRTITLSEAIYKPVVGVDNYSITLNSGDKLHYSSAVDIASLQDINLASPVSTFSFTGSNFPSVAGKYIRKNDDPTIYIYPASDQSIAGSTLWLRNCLEISAAVDIPAGTHTDFVTSTDSTAYPQDGDVGDYHYTYLGQLGGGARIEVGSYVGTGTYGKSNPNTLTFGFVPKLIVIDPGNWATNSTPNWPLIGVKNHPYLYRNSNYGERDNLITWLKNGVEFYSAGGASYHLNTSGVTYHYIAIG